MPPFLYKYCAWGKGEQAIITAGTLLWQNPRKWNDPFDTKLEVDSESFQRIEVTRPELIERFIQSRGISKTAYRKNRDRYINALYDAIAFDESNKFYEKQAVLCLSAAPSNLLMWSHYGSGHTGVMFEFQSLSRIPESKVDSTAWIAQRLWSMPVLYSERRPSLMYGLDPDEVFLRKLFLQKSSVWSYEREYRCFNSKQPGVYPYKRSSLVSVVCGWKMPEQQVSECFLMIEETNKRHGLDIRGYRARDTKGRYQIHVPGHPRLNRSNLPEYLERLNCDYAADLESGDTVCGDE